MTRLLSAALCLLMLVTIFAACDDKSNKGGLVPGATTTTTTTPMGGGGGGGDVYATNANGHAVQLVPETLNYGGDEIAELLIYRGGSAYLFPENYIDNNPSDIRNKIYDRNMEIEEKRGIHFDITVKEAHMSSKDENGEELYNAVLQGTTTADAICAYSLFLPLLALEGVLVDINTLEYPSTEMPWFAEDIQEYSIMDRLYFVANNSSIANLKAIWCVFANRVMIENEGLEDIEDVILDGRWTLDMMQTYSRNWATEAEQAPDSVYGVFLVHPRTSAHPFYYGAGFTATRRAADGSPEYAFMSQTDRELIDQFVDKFIGLLDSPECDFGPYSGATTKPLTDATAAFFVASIEYYTYMSDETTYAFIPMPKMSEAQERYLSCRQDNWDMWGITYQGDPEMAGVIIDDISYSDYDVIAPAFWDKDFKYRYSDSDKGVQIFNIIRDSVSTDFGRLYRQNIGNPFGGISDCIWDKPENPPTVANVWIPYIEDHVEGYTSSLLDLKIKIASLKAPE